MCAGGGCGGVGCGDAAGAEGDGDAGGCRGLEGGNGAGGYRGSGGEGLARNVVAHGEPAAFGPVRGRQDGRDGGVVRGVPSRPARRPGPVGTPSRAAGPSRPRSRRGPGASLRGLPGVRGPSSTAAVMMAAVLGVTPSMRARSPALSWGRACTAPHSSSTASAVRPRLGPARIASSSASLSVFTPCCSRRSRATRPAARGLVPVLEVMRGRLSGRGRAATAAGRPATGASPGISAARSPGRRATA